MNLDSRISKYNFLIHKIAYMSDNQLNELAEKQNKNSNIGVKWGDVGSFSIDGIKVFYKKLPLAKLFYENKMNTSNLYNLPAYYNYGYGSAGINPWRELITHINLSDYVLEGQIGNFPILYDWRIIKDGEKNFESGLSDKLMEFHGNNPKIRKYLEERYDCEYKILILLEHIPFVLYDYLDKNPSYISKFESESKKILDFLGTKNILDLDAHQGNYLVDSDKNLYLTDFGLVLDKNFELDKDERVFMKKNKKLPYYYFYESVYSMYKFKAFGDKKIKELFDKELKNKSDKITYTNVFIKSIVHINKILKLPKLFITIIKTNKNKIIKTILLKNKYINSKDKKNIFISEI